MFYCSSALFSYHRRLSKQTWIRALPALTPQTHTASHSRPQFIWLLYLIPVFNCTKFSSEYFCFLQNVYKTLTPIELYFFFSALLFWLPLGNDSFREKIRKKKQKTLTQNLGLVRYDDYDARKSKLPANVRVEVTAPHSCRQYVKHPCIGVRAPAPFCLLMVAHKTPNAYAVVVNHSRYGNCRATWVWVANRKEMLNFLCSWKLFAKKKNVARILPLCSNSIGCVWRNHAPFFQWPTHATACEWF